MCAPPPLIYEETETDCHPQRAVTESGEDGMMWSFLPLLLLALLRPGTTGATLTQQCDSPTDGTIYNYHAKTLDGRYTYQYVELNALQEEMKHLGLIVLGFPCNQFGKQEPGKPHEILSALKHVRPGDGFVPNFLLLEKGDVNGQDEQEVFTLLKRACPPVGGDFGNPNGRLFWEPLKISDIKWNFEKFLAGPDGKPVMRWHPAVNISTVRADIRNYLFRLYTQDLN
ncbi:unnamed protein product [Menidia menidia]|uniref:Glutathione peroxidase n=1 Tax=Menidia menidia TaxID=238744 RepID=A0A8S4BM58_9TELE|nr:unnamed protein product [Menidia menidia]